MSTKKNHYLQHSTHTPTRQATILQRRHLVLLLRQLSFFIFGLFLCPKLTLQCTVEGAGENTVNPDTADHPRDRHHKRSVRRDKRYFLLSCSSPTSAITSTCAYKVYSPFPRMRIIILLCVNQRWTGLSIGDTHIQAMHNTHHDLVLLAGVGSLSLSDCREIK